MLGKNIQEFTTSGVTTCLLEMLEKSGEAALLKNAEGGLFPPPAPPQQTVPSKLSNSTCGKKETAVLGTFTLWLAGDSAALQAPGETTEVALPKPEGGQSLGSYQVLHQWQGEK